jgi:hypothetical protein
VGSMALPLARLLARLLQRGRLLASARDRRAGPPQCVPSRTPSPSSRSHPPAPHLSTRHVGFVQVKEYGLARGINLYYGAALNGTPEPGSAAAAAAAAAAATTAPRGRSGSLIISPTSGAAAGGSDTVPPFRLPHALVEVAGLADAVFAGRAQVMQRVGLSVPSDDDEWVPAGKGDVGRLSLQWEGLKFLLQDCIPHLMEDAASIDRNSSVGKVMTDQYAAALRRLCSVMGTYFTAHVARHLFRLALELRLTASRCEHKHPALLYCFPRPSSPAACRSVAFEAGKGGCGVL